jgi:hypothetical protein
MFVFLFQLYTFFVRLPSNITHKTRMTTKHVNQFEWHILYSMLNSTETASEIIVARLGTVTDVLIPNEKTFPVYDARFADFSTCFCKYL